MDRLKAYRDVCTRIEIINHRLRKQEESYAILSDDGIEGAQLASKPITDMPIYHGMPGSTVERVAAMREKASEAVMADIQKDAEELAALKLEKERIEILLRSVKERERFIIKLHLINGLFWRDVARRYAMNYADDLTEPALKYIMTQGLDRMLKYAEAIYVGNGIVEQKGDLRDLREGVRADGLVAI